MGQRREPLFLVGVISGGAGLGDAGFEIEANDLRDFAVPVDPLLDAPALRGRSDDQVGLASQSRSDLGGESDL